MLWKSKYTPRQEVNLVFILRKVATESLPHNLIQLSSLKELVLGNEEVEKESES